MSQPTAADIEASAAKDRHTLSETACDLIVIEHRLRDVRGIRAAMSAMPCAATERVPKPWVAMGDVVDADAVVAFMEGLAEVLGEVAAESDKHRRRLFSLGADVEAFRRLLGTAPAEVTP